MAKLELDHLRREYGDFVAVHGISLTVEEGETIALLGPSGCGKTTTLNMIAGLELPTSGDIRVDGQSVAHLPAGKRNVGLVFQDYAIFTHMNTFQNLAFGLQIRRLPHSRVRDEVQRIARLLDLEKVLHAPTAQLSLSELQRVAIGRTLVTHPPILLLDEPLSNLESAMRAQMRLELRRLHEETGQTLVYVTHDQVEALSLADRIAVMDSGHLRQFGTPAEIYRQPANTFVAGFIGSPPMNLFVLQAARQGDARTLAGKGINLGGALVADWHLDLSEGRKVWVGVRPEHLRLSGAADAPMRGQVFGVEFQGADAILNVDVGGTALRILVPAADRVPAGASVGLSVEPGHLHLFDHATGVALNPGARRAG